MTYKIFTAQNYRNLSQISRLSEEQCFNIDVVSQVLPFKTNNYVVEELIDWDHFESDPLFILNFPQKDMLKETHFNAMADLVKRGAERPEISRLAQKIRLDLNPHPAGQLEHNVPLYKGEPLTGIQHKYRETMLFFPTQGQSCHAYCTFCFRWPQFVGLSDLKFAMKQTDLMISYIKDHPEITDVLFTGGDPMVMKTKHLETYLNAILDADIPHVKNIRIGTKSLSFWPYRFLSDPDADDLLRLFEKVSRSGKHLALMAHFNNPAEMKTDAVAEASRRIQSTGARIRTQSPILNHINADADIWSEMWKKQVSMGMIPYYMFIARDTGAQDYFAIPLVKAIKIFDKAYSSVSGISRTVRGPSMSADPGKVMVIGTTEIHGEKAIALNFTQARNPEWINRPFFAKYDENAIWLDDLKPAFGDEKFFYEDEFNAMFD